MIVFLNGAFLPDAEATISIHDRGFLYGDGLFETLRIYGGHLFRWHRHLDRLEQGAAFLGIPVPFTRDQITQAALELIRRNALRDARLRITLTRGPGAPGYSIQRTGKPTLLMAVSPLTQLAAEKTGWSLVTSRHRVASGDLLSGIKGCNKLRQILARREAELAGAQEALLLNTDGYVAEAAASNIFWEEKGGIWTPPLSDGLLPGITRELTLELCAGLGILCGTKSITPDELRASDGIFLTVSTLELVPVRQFDGTALRPPSRLADLQAAYRRVVAAECGGGR